MNRATRTFIWGLIQIAVGAYAMGAVIDKGFDVWYRYVFLVAALLTILNGINKASKTTD